MKILILIVHCAKKIIVDLLLNVIMIYVKVNFIQNVLVLIIVV